MIVGCVVEWEDRVLLCRRAIEPRHGYWTLPAGFLELGESAEAGAVRETLEEAGASVELLAPFTLFSVPHVNQVHVYYRARLMRPEFQPGEESLEVELVAEADVPWEQLAFTTVRETLRHWFADRTTGMWGVHHGTVQRDPKSGR
jgi:ADP-ribose pyrophosphatase YjhB (NUDIX family)